VIGLPAFQPFKPGRIDHHNVQIAIAVLAMAATAWSDRVRWSAIAAGALTGLGLAIGYEGMPFLVLCGAIVTLRYLADETGRGALRGYGMSVAASTAAGFLATVGPNHWWHSACDSLAINSATAVVAGGLGLALITLRRDAGAPLRCGMAAAVALAAAAAFAVPEPRCLLGPYAMVDPAMSARCNRSQRCLPTIRSPGSGYRRFRLRRWLPLRCLPRGTRDAVISDS
jgi:hypothetical protein